MKGSAATLHSTDAHGADYMFNLVDAAIFILCRDPQVDRVDIHLHPQATEDPPFEGLRRAMSTWLGSPRAAIQSAFRSLRRRIGIVHGAMAAQPTDHHASDGKTDASVHERVMRLGEVVTLRTHAGDVTLRRTGGTSRSGFMERWARGGRALRLWIRCHAGGRFDARRYLQIRYRGVHIGDLAASNALRIHSNAGGSMHRCDGLWTYLHKAVALCDYVMDRIPAGGTSDYAATPEPPYLPSVFTRGIRAKGGRIVQLHHFRKTIDVVEPGDVYRNPRIIEAHEKPVLTDEQERSVKTYFDERFRDPRKHLTFLTTGTNNVHDTELRDPDGAVVDHPSDGLSAVLFLHSFDDGQFWYGLDGFDDLWHWTTFTIDSLISNHSVVRLYIKPHPNTDAEKCPGDGIAEDRLKRRYAGNTKVVWLRKDVNPLAFQTLRHLVAVTHHGSIAEELAYLGIPVIGSSCARWGADCRFVHVWRTVEEYGRLLASLSPDSMPQVDRAMRSDLLRFAFAYRMSAPNMQTRYVWWKFATMLAGRAAGMDQASYRRATGMLKALKADSKELHDLLGLLVRENRERQARSIPRAAS